MIAKLGTGVLFLASLCMAFPVDDEQRPPSDASVPIVPPQPIAGNQDIPPPQAVPLPIPEGHQPEGQGEGQLQDGPVPPEPPAGGKPENSDLKTDSSFWYRKSYYPVIYGRSYYRPRSYSYSYYTPYYSYWNPYSWW